MHMCVCVYRAWVRSLTRRCYISIYISIYISYTYISLLSIILVTHIYIPIAVSRAGAMDQCISMYTSILVCMLVYILVHQCISMYTSILVCILVYILVMHTSLYSLLY